MIQVSQFPIETQRLKLRAWQLSDVNDFFDYASVDGVGEMAGWPHHLDITTSMMVLKSFLTKDDVYAIVDKSTNKVIGSLGVHDSWTLKDKRFDGLNIKEIGYVLARSHWGNGLIPEAVEGVLLVCFEKWNLDAVACSHFDGNKQSKRVIEKCGFDFIDCSEIMLDQLDNKKVILHKYLRYK